MPDIYIPRLHTDNHAYKLKTATVTLEERKGGGGEKRFKPGYPVAQQLKENDVK